MDVVGFDCEMVGVGPWGRTSVLARATVVDQDGRVLLDRYVRPQQEITDYRTEKSGIRREDLLGAPSFHQVRHEVVSALEGRIIVGHELGYDFKALAWWPLEENIRDTAVYFHDYEARKTPSLKYLAKSKLGSTIQTGEHSSEEDAWAALKLYLSKRKDWEKMEDFKTSFGAVTSLKHMWQTWETFSNEQWSLLADKRVRLVGQVGSVNSLRNVTFFDLKGDRVRVQVMDTNRTDKLENGQIIGVEGKMIKGKKGYPLVADSYIRILVDVRGNFSHDEAALVEDAHGINIFEILNSYIDIQKLLRLLLCVICYIYILHIYS